MAGAAKRGEGAPGWPAVLAAGAGAGVVAAIVAVGVEIVGHAPVPPRPATAWSAFVAGILGGLLYGVLCRTTRRPVAAFWVLTLAIATVDSVLIAALPLPAGPGPRTGIPIVGLTVPLRMLGALVGVGHFSTRHFPAPYLAVDTAVHYVTAIVAAICIPLWAPRR